MSGYESHRLLTASNVILALKIAVGAVTVLWLLSLAALARRNYWLHGRINIAFFILTIIALVSLELVVRMIDPAIFDSFDEVTRRMLHVHLSFSVPCALLLPVMLFTGLTHRRDAHLYLAGVFTVLWIGTFVTGIFFLPH